MSSMTYSAAISRLAIVLANRLSPEEGKTALAFGFPGLYEFARVVAVIFSVSPEQAAKDLREKAEIEFKAMCFSHKVKKTVRKMKGDGK